MTRVAILLYLSLAIAGFGWKGVKSLSSGAPSTACDNLSPNPAQHGAQPQTSAVPYSIDLSVLNDPTSGQPAYSPGQTYTLSLSGNSGENFRGLLIQTRTVADDSRVGTFAVAAASSGDTRLSSCSPQNIGITHSNRVVKTTVSFQWTAPPQGTGAIRFRFAVVQERVIYWADQSSAMVQELVMTVDATTVAATGGTTTMPGGPTGEATTQADGGDATSSMATLPENQQTMVSMATLPENQQTMVATDGAMKSVSPWILTILITILCLRAFY